MDLGSN